MLTARQTRTERRAAERQAQKLARKLNPQNAIAVAGENEIGFASQPGPAPSVGFVPQTAAARAAINRQNAQLSTGPRTLAGKLASSRNAVKHGLTSGQLIVDGEDPVQYQALLDDLMQEHQPASPAEQLLVTELAQSYWLTQRALRLQNDCFGAAGEVDEKRLALFLRYQSTHQRAFHKALAALIAIRKVRAKAGSGFVPQSAYQPAGFVPQNEPAAESMGQIDVVSQRRQKAVPIAA